MIIGYIRQCRTHPGIDEQAASLFEHGAEKIYLDDGSADTIGEILAMARPGDTVVACSLTVLFPNRPSLYALADRLHAGGIALAAVEENLDTAGPHGEALLRFLRAVRYLETHPEPVDGPVRDGQDVPSDEEPYAGPEGPGGPEPYDDGHGEPERYGPGGPEDAGAPTAPGRPAAPERAPDPGPWPVPTDDGPDGSAADWIPDGQSPARRVQAVHTSEPWAYWVPAQPSRRPRTVTVLYPEFQPAWFPDPVAPPTVRRPAPDPWADWIPDRPGRPCHAPDDTGPAPGWLPDVLPGRTYAGPELDDPSGWLPEYVPDEIAYRVPKRRYTPDRADWIAPPRPDMARSPRQRRALQAEPAGTPVPICPDPSQAGTLPPEAVVRPHVRPVGPDGSRLILIAPRPDAEKAIGAGVDGVERPKETRMRPPTAAERLIIRQMREQSRITGLRHMVIAAIIAALIILGLLAATLPKLATARRVTGSAGSAVPYILVRTDPDGTGPGGAPSVIFSPTE